MAMPEDNKQSSPGQFAPANLAAAAAPARENPSAPETAKAVGEKAAAEPAASNIAAAKAAAVPPSGQKPAAAATPNPPAAKPAAAAKPAPAPPKPPVPKPEPWESELVRRLKAQYGSGIREASTYAKQNCLLVDSSIAYEILLRMRDDELFDYCVDITAVHYPKREQPFDIVYILYSFHKNERIRIKTQIADGERLRSAVSLWPTANWLEREVFDMFGVGFDGHPELKRILMPEDWKGHPLRKDYAILQQDTEWVKTNIGIESAQ
jgi:NADH-quinone oxidoreductase subunit C